jgi:nucleoside-diphosphate-sugar epimerase
MDPAKPTIIVTGISGNLGQRLLSQITDATVVGIDFTPPTGAQPHQFVSMDLGSESSTRELYLLMRDIQPAAVVHLAFILDPQRAGVLDVDQMWHINVAGTARVMEAISEANRNAVATIRRFIFASSVAVYGSETPTAVTEDAPLRAHTLPYAIHKHESDLVVQQRAPAMRACSVVILRPHIFAGASVENYMMGAFHGTPNGKGKRAARMREQKKRLPCMLPYGEKYLDNKIQFVHVDDMARLIAWFEQREPEAQRLTILNVAGSGEPLTFRQCIQMARAKLVRVPGKWAMHQVLKLLWNLKISAIPPAALPYLTGQYIMNTDRLKNFLGADYRRVIQHSVSEAFAESFRTA